MDPWIGGSPRRLVIQHSLTLFVLDYFPFRRIATAVTLVAFFFSFSTHITVTLIASLLSFLAALLTLIAFAIDIAFFALVQHEVKELGIETTTKPGPGSSIPPFFSSLMEDQTHFHL